MVLVFMFKMEKKNYFSENFLFVFCLQLINYFLFVLIFFKK